MDPVIPENVHSVDDADFDVVVGAGDQIVEEVGEVKMDKRHSAFQLVVLHHLWEMLEDDRMVIHVNVQLNLVCGSY